jgi:hypothetical protein
MELNELTQEERIALVALVELVVKSGAVSDEEVEELQRIVASIGEDAYGEAADEVGKRFRDESELKAFLSTITRQEAREVIYEAVLEAAMPDAISARESELLEWLGTEWDVATSFDEPDLDA